MRLTKISAATGEHGFEFVVVNRSQRSCQLIGYPAVRINSGQRALPFIYANGGGPYVTTNPPKMVTLKPGGSVLFEVVKYRCDVGTGASASSIRIWLPGVAGSRVLLLPKPYDEGYSYCSPASPPASSDLGNTVVVSPLVEAPTALTP